ncbi:endonuclease/exonuclease/phosphatase family protein [Termitidicoccus mucosus]|uniref:Endonuclease/exonuclease/phosphatase domain-containing protein n=1 Tax=Termitidicoccus mucosus TaxID=1184151 RepID=A0A178IJE4_9BACT|nr:hypothetical protein AW736_10710 [Opitutaceae bacterium TSB47]
MKQKMNHLRQNNIPWTGKARAFMVLMMALPVALAQASQSEDGVPARARKAADSVRVVTANIRQMLDADIKTGNSWEQRKELCRDVLIAQEADIFCFQESRLAQMLYFEQAMPGFAHFGIGNPRKDDAPPEPINAIMYSTKRFEKVDSGGFWLSATPDTPTTHFEGSSNRLANWLRLKDRKSGREIIVWNTHLHHVGDAVREKQIAVLLARTGKISAGIPQILTADFNTSAERAVIKSIKAAGWTDSYAFMHGPEDPGLTAHRFLGAELGATPEGQKRRKIDFVFCNGQFRPIDAEVIRDSRAGRYPSDHYFVSAELEYAKGSGTDVR